MGISLEDSTELSELTEAGVMNLINESSLTTPRCELQEQQGLGYGECWPA